MSFAAGADFIQKQLVIAPTYICAGGRDVTMEHYERAAEIAEEAMRVKPEKLVPVNPQRFRRVR